MSKSDAYVLVRCDTCGEFEEIELTAIAGGGWDERNVAAGVARLGWRDEGDNIHTCNICLEDWDGEE
jgi:hypothetical protein